MHVANLQEIALNDQYTWKDIRDAMHRSYRGTRGAQKIEILTFHLAYPEVKEEPWAVVAGSTFKELSSEYTAHLNGFTPTHCNHTKAFFERVGILSGELRSLLTRHQLIKASESRSGEWTLTERGAGLFRQKAIRRISRKEAGKKLARVLAAAKEFNADKEQCYGITRIVLFGSLLDSNAKDVGDIDIMMEIARRTDGLKFDEWAERERDRLYVERPSAFDKEFPNREGNAAKHLKKVSPYVSIEPFISFDQFVEEGHSVLTIFAAKSSDEMHPYSTSAKVSTLDHVNAIENRMRLVEELECPELFSQEWDCFLS